MASFELFSRWRAATAGALVAFGVWACLNPETDDFPTYENGAGGSGATAVDPNGGGTGGAFGDGAGGSGAAGGPATGNAGGSGGTAPSPPANPGPDPDAGAPDAGPADAGSLVSDAG